MKEKELKTFLYRIQPKRVKLLKDGGTPEEQKLIGKHFDYLKKLTEKRVVFLAGRTLNQDKSSFGIVIFFAANEKAAEKIMNNDPAVKHGVFNAELFPYSIALIQKMHDI